MHTSLRWMGTMTGQIQPITTKTRVSYETADNTRWHQSIEHAGLQLNYIALSVKETIKTMIKSDDAHLSGENLEKLLLVGISPTKLL